MTISTKQKQIKINDTIEPSRPTLNLYKRNRLASFKKQKIHMLFVPNMYVCVIICLNFNKTS